MWFQKFTIAALMGAGVLLLSACAGGGARGPSTTANGGSRAEPVTESDEPENTKRARLRVTLAANYFAEGQDKVALDEVKQALVAESNYAPAYVLRGMIYMRLNDDVRAEDSFKRALQINPRESDALHNYGWFLCSKARYAEGLRYFEAALANPLYGGRAKTQMTKGICETRDGQLAAAEASFVHAYELDAANPITGYNLAALLFKRKEDSRAQFYIRRLNNSELANAESLWLGIKVEQRLKDTVAMAQLAQQLERRFPTSKEWALYQRGAFYE
ncbi:type IV pilus biogenesis/stability protein PilW [Hydrogenophaga sp. PAMC20947]|nr:type IV pilus biogenesis/stability protein PilW [Hydrogenophaga sp. PAMC20947]